MVHTWKPKDSGLGTGAEAKLFADDPYESIPKGMADNKAAEVTAAPLVLRKFLRVVFIVSWID